MEHSAINNRFVAFATKLCLQFPELDLRFNLKGGTTRVRYLAAGTSPEIFEVDLGRVDLETTLQEAILNIKQIAQLFDA